MIVNMADDAFVLLSMRCKYFIDEKEDLLQNYISEEYVMRCISMNQMILSPVLNTHQRRFLSINM